MFPFQIYFGRILVGSIIIGLIGLYATIQNDGPAATAEMRIDPLNGVITINHDFTVAVIVSSETPVNAFSGQVTYDPTILEVVAIDYNVSIADLWVEEPWYSAGEGIISFAGGTTVPGGFSGKGDLLKITFRPIVTGNALIGLSDAHVYEHDGFGTEAPLADSVDALFSVETIETLARSFTQANQAGTIAVVTEPVDFDLNENGEIDLADISIFMLNLLRYDFRYDFNQDEVVDRLDLTLLLDARKNSN